MSDTTREIAYRLSAKAVRRRALAGAGLGVVRSLAPLALAVVLLRRLGWATPLLFWVVLGAVAALVVVRAVVGYGATRRRLASLEVTLGDEAIAVGFRTAGQAEGSERMTALTTARGGFAIERGRVARVSEVDGPLGGLVVESQPDPRTGVVLVANVPRGGDGYAALRHRLERWRTFERRGRRGPAARVAVFAIVVAGIFFVPFFVDDFVVHSKLLGAMLVAGLLLVLRGTVRG